MTRYDTRRTQQIAMTWGKAQSAVFAYVRSVVPDYHHAEDVVQRVAATVVEKYDEYDPARPFTAWAIGLARIEILRYRAEQSRDRLIFDEAVIEKVTQAYANLAPRVDDLQEALEYCVDQLQGKNRAVLDLHYLRDMKPQDVADRMGISSNSVYVILHRIRTVLRKCIRLRLAGDSKTSQADFGDQAATGGEA